MSFIRFAGCAFLFVALVCGVVATAIDYWYYHHTSAAGMGFARYFGLWNSCGKADGHKSPCYSWTYIKKNLVHKLELSWLHACQGLMIIGVVWNMVAFIGALLTSLRGHTVKLPRIAAIICAICYIIAVIVFASKYQDELLKPAGLSVHDGQLHAGFGLAVVAVILTVAGAVLAGVGQTAAGYYNL